ncbi:uncharacterized protein [Nicotiana sylvestris]|uniref:uncharacterized protein n=1 Tax=Nicotiana sylvestris TaxID=4096 RepID=UPI00388C7876
MAPPPPPVTLYQSSSEPLFQTHNNQYYPPEPTFKAPEPYSYTRFDLPVETEKPSKNSKHEEMFRKVKSLEQSFRNMQGLGGQVSVAYKDLCLFPDVQLPVGFKMPKFDLYDGHGDPVTRLRGFCSKMRGAGRKDELLMAYFCQSLIGSYNLEIVPDRLSLTKIEKKHNESFREYGSQWREQATRVDPPMKEREMVDYFLQALEPTYYDHLVSAIGKSFNEVVNMGDMAEEGLKSNKITSYSAIKATTQAIQSGTRGVIGKKKKEDVATIDSGAWLRQLDMLRPIESKLPNPPPKNLDYSELIDTKRIEVQAPEAPNINQNLLPTHQETNMIEIVHKGGEPKKSSQAVMMIRSSEVKPVEKSTSERSMIKLSGTNDEHRQALMKILNEAHVKISVNHLEKIANKIFEVNRVSFSDDELPMEGTEHNRALYLTVKCEDSMVTQVLVNNGSNANICPLSTLNKLKVDAEWIHKNSICVRGFDGRGKDSLGDIVLELTIGPTEFTMEFQELDVAVSYNLLLGRPWIHAAKAVPSTLH